MHHKSVIKIMNFQQQMRILHWQTTSFARHNAYGGIYDSIDDLLDKFAEICMGKYGRIELTDEISELKLKNMKDFSINSYLNEFCDFLVELTGEFDDEKDTDVLNIRDEILSEVNKLKYLLTLK
jgi:DNA-binding ferritin-like protein